MARNQTSEKNEQTQLAVNLVLDSHQMENGVEEINFETDSEMMDDEQERLRRFLESRRGKKAPNSVFFKINNSPIMGSKGQKLWGGAVPLFDGAALDLKNAELIGEKRFLKPPEASGTGGILVLMPQKFNQGIMLPLSSLKLKENFVEGKISLNNRSGFHGNHIRLTAESINLSIEKAEFINPRLIYKTEDDESSVPVPEKVFVNKEGIFPEQISSSLRIEAPEKKTDMPEQIENQEIQTVQEDETVSTNIPETVSEMINDENETKEQHDHIVFQANGGRFRTKNKRVAFGSYDSFLVEWKNGRLIAVVTVKGNETELELNELDGYHRYSASDGITVEKEDNIGIINEFFSKIGLDDTEADTTEICYGGLEISEDGIFFDSLKDSSFSASIGDDWELKLGNNIELGFSGDFVKYEEAEDDSYLDLAKAVLEYFGIMEDEGESEEEAEEDSKGNNFSYSVPLIMFPVIPGLVSLDAKFNAGAKIGYKINGSINNIKGALQNQQSETFGLDLRAALTGDAYAGFKAGITAGTTFLMNVSANIGAKISLAGGDNGVLSAGVHTEFKKGRKGMPHFEKAVFDALGELRLKALIDGSIDTQILGWERTLYSYTFKEWELAAIMAEIKATKENGNKWKADAGLSYSALSGNVKGSLESGDNLEKMFEKQEASYGKSAFDGSQSSFEDTKKMLMAYHDKSVPMFVNAAGANSGFLNMNNTIKDIQRRFYIQLRTNEDTIAAQMQELEELKQDKDYKKLETEIQSGINIHTANLKNISNELNKQVSGNYGSVSNTGASSDRIMNAYVTGGGNKSGFKEYLKEKAQKEAVTVPALIDYEVRRINELSKKSGERINQLLLFAKSIGVVDYNDTTNGGQLLNKYVSLGGKAVKKAEFTDIASLRKREEDRLAKKHSSQFSISGRKYRAHTERLDKLGIRFPDIVQKGSDIPNAEFYEYYTKTLGASQFRKMLDLYSNRDRLLAYEKSTYNSKISSDKQGRAAAEKRDEIRQLLSLGVRDKTQQERLDELISSGISAMENDKKAAYMTATTDDLVNALNENAKVNTVKTLMERRSDEHKKDKNKRWIYEAIKMDLTINDLIEYERARIEEINNKSYLSKKSRESDKQKHIARLNALIRKNDEANAKSGTDALEAEKIRYNAIQEYFNFDSNRKDDRAEGFLDDVNERVEKGDTSVLKLFMGTEWTPEESREIAELRKKGQQDSVYGAIRESGIKSGSKSKHKNNREILQSYMAANGKRNYTVEDLDRYYTYQIHRATSADSISGVKADHTTVLEIIEKINDYPEMLKKYKELGRGSGFLKHEQEEAGNWVTPNMILQYERNRISEIDRKHLERVENLAAAESGTAEEKAQAAKNFAESSKRYEREGGYDNVKISLNDIILAEESRQSAKMSIHNRRIEQLRATDVTDEEKIKAYDGTRFEPDKAEVDRLYKELEDKINSSPEAMADELTSYENQEKEKQEELQKRLKQMETDISDRIMTLAKQAEQCLNVINDTENAIRNPASVFENESQTEEYVENVLERTERDITQVPEVINKAIN